MMKFKLAEIIVTFFYIGKIKYASQMIGSTVCAILYYSILWFIFPIIRDNLIKITILHIIILLALFFAGHGALVFYCKHKQHARYNEVIIDKIFGQILTLVLCIFTIVIIMFTKLPFISYIYSTSIMLSIPVICFNLFSVLMANNSSSGRVIIIATCIFAFPAIIVFPIITITIFVFVIYLKLSDILKVKKFLDYGNMDFNKAISIMSDDILVAIFASIMTYALCLSALVRFGITL